MTVSHVSQVSHDVLNCAFAFIFRSVVYIDGVAVKPIILLITLVTSKTHYYH